MNIRRVNSADKINFKAGFAWSPEIPEKFVAKLINHSVAFAKSTERGDSCLFIKQVRENGDIERAFLGEMRIVSVENEMASVKLNGISKSDFPSVNIDSPNFLAEMIERYKAMLAGTKALNKNSEHVQRIKLQICNNVSVVIN